MMTWSNRILRAIAFAARLDIAAGLALATALLIWTAWH
jgi:hypothetical protein